MPSIISYDSVHLAHLGPDDPYLKLVITTMQFYHFNSFTNQIVEITENVNAQQGSAETEDIEVELVVG